MPSSYYKTLIFFLALCSYIIFNGNVPITDPVESNYALTAKEMVESNNWLSPQIYGQYWFDKPILIYWLIALSYKVFGVGEFAARFPAAVFSAASVSLVYWFSVKIYQNRQIGLLAALVLATSLEFWVLAHMIITDAVLFFFTSAAMSTFFFGMTEKRTKWYLMAYASMGFAALTKGPVGIVLPALIVLMYIFVRNQWQQLRHMHIFAGIGVLLAVAAPWYFTMYLLHGQQFIDTFLGLHNYIRATVAEHPKDNVLYYYFVLFPVSLMPWTGIFFLMLGKAKRSLRSPVESYLYIWPAVILVFYTAMATKYPTYVFPALFPVAVLIASYLQSLHQRKNRRTWLWLSVPAIVLFGAVVYGTTLLPPEKNWLPLYVAVCVSIISVIWVQTKGNICRLPLTVAVAVITISCVAIGTGLSSLANSKSAKPLAYILPRNAIIGSLGEYATSMVFYSGHIMPRLVVDEQELAQRGTWSGKYTMPTEHLDSFVARNSGDSPIFILVKSKDLSQIKDSASFANFVPVASHGNMTLYRKKDEI
ncbi:ArnT family glycosyltransferase [Methylomusa anaerophila]|uniref:Undecaprenyl phosphate-alpha-4-amino-4-deoxy-L-arabinose arabinosyl transferase n=2 Tax=Methylomusa anaerophila TaxID=1930071 RepID=A0A348AQE8_9FIRM|nr:glycosyltransferase family 39 protein [Methylomusa anaerophila]BBB93296.1 undecaprenyl phosphate-alpha-4-amino-4-deoxy-L-arabinose arabinosyl transferase [Methylomusa anaerophila]